MAFTSVRRILALNILLTIISVNNAPDAPPIKIQAFKPKGFRAYIDGSRYVSQFIFHGNVNKPIGSSDVGTLSGEGYRVSDGTWVFEDLDLELKVGDVINYYIYLSNDINMLKGDLVHDLTYTITELEEFHALRRTETGTPAETEIGISAPNIPDCEDTLTKIFGGRTACAGQTIFEDNFDSSRLKENLWQIEQYIPTRHSEYPFVSYQRLSSNPTVSVFHPPNTSFGILRIAPTLQQNVPGYNEDSITSGKINLFSSCTAEAEACFKTAQGADILPPIISGRITSKGFAFKYGTIHVRAKLPLGDWLYPEILLEPFESNRYGRSRYASGVMKIACARGNQFSFNTLRPFGSGTLFGGPIMDFTCRDTLLQYNFLPSDKQWGDEFHVYSLRWEPDRITLSVDGVEWGRVEPDASGLVGKFPKDECKDLQRELLGYRSKLAPFDDYFYIALGVAAGGITEFPDGSFTGSNRPKPWTNAGRKAMLTFWQDMHNWITTWSRQPELLVDYVRVVAL